MSKKKEEQVKKVESEKKYARLPEKDGVCRSKVNILIVFSHNQPRINMMNGI